MVFSLPSIFKKYFFLYCCGLACGLFPPNSLCFSEPPPFSGLFWTPYYPDSASPVSQGHNCLSLGHLETTPPDFSLETFQSCYQSHFPAQKNDPFNTHPLSSNIYRTTLVVGRPIIPNKELTVKGKVHSPAHLSFGSWWAFLRYIPLASNWQICRYSVRIYWANERFQSI